MALFLHIFWISTLAFAFSITEIPNPRTINQWAVDKAGVFSPSEKAQLEAKLEEIHHSTGAEVAVVTLPSVGEEVPKTVAVDLFKLWHIGRKGRDDGLLLLLVTDQRRLEIETGYGLEGILPDARLAKLQREVMIPELKAGHPGDAFFKGLSQIEGFLQTQDYDSPPLRSFARPGSWLALYFPFAFSILFNLISAVMILFLFFEKDPNAAYQKLEKSFGFLFYWQISCLVFPLEWMFFRRSLSSFWVGLGIAIAWFIGGQLFRGQWKKLARATPRECPECGKMMALQNSAREKNFETAKEQTEEEIGSVDYDIWVCPDLHVQKIFFPGKNNDLYCLCPSCRARTARVTEDQVILAPTYSAPGKGLKKLQCVACKAKNALGYEIPMMIEASDSSSGSSSSGGGSSFSGGSSGGGGAGSNY